MTIHIAYFLLIFLLQKFCLSSAARQRQNPITNWTARDFSTFLDGHQIRHDKSKLEAMDINGHSIFAKDTISPDILENAKISNADVARINEFLYIKKASVSLTPRDIWEFRLANMRLFDMWLIPIVNAPRVLLIWIRYFNKNNGVDRFDDQIDNISEGFFWLSFIFAPSRPLILITSEFKDSSSLADEFIYYSFLLRNYLEMTASLFLFYCFATRRDFSKVAKCLVVFVAFEIGFSMVAFFLYYIAWNLLSEAVLNFSFSLLIYVLVPLMVVGEAAFLLTCGLLTPFFVFKDLLLLHPQIHKD